MAVAETLTKELFDKCSDEVKGMYRENGEGYVLDLPPKDPEPGDDVAALRNALYREREDRRSAQAELKKIEDDKKTNAKTTLIEKGDLGKLTAAHVNELAETKAASEKREADLINRLVDRELQSTVNELSVIGGTKAKLLSPYISSQLTATMDDSGQVVIKYPEGKTRTEFEKSLVDDPDFSDIIVGTKATGSGATGKNSSSGGAPTAKKFSEYKPGALVQMRKTEAGRAQYDKLKAAKDN